jgi:hypothetical protein
VGSIPVSKKTYKCQKRPTTVGSLPDTFCAREIWNSPVYNDLKWYIYKYTRALDFLSFFFEKKQSAPRSLRVGWRRRMRIGIAPYAAHGFCECTHAHTHIERDRERNSPRCDSAEFATGKFWYFLFFLHTQAFTAMWLSRVEPGKDFFFHWHFFNTRRYSPRCDSAELRLEKFYPDQSWELSDSNLRDRCVYVISLFCLGKKKLRDRCVYVISLLVGLFIGLFL